MAVDSSLTENRLETTVDETLGTAVDRTVENTAGGFRLVVSDRTVALSRRDGPAEAVHWVLTLQADGATVGKYGPYESTDELLTQLRSVLTSDVFYTVCCDGEPDN